MRPLSPGVSFVLAGALAAASCREAPRAEAPRAAEEPVPGAPSISPPEARPSWLEQPAPPAANGWEKRFAEAGSDAEKIAILEEKAALGRDDLLGLAKLAVAGGSPEVSMTALSLAVQLRGDEAVELFSEVTRLEDAEVRRLGIEAIRELPGEQRLEIYSALVGTDVADGLDIVVGDLALEANKPAFEILIEAFAHEDQAVRAQLDDATMRLVGQTFGSLEEARRWWAASSRRFDERLNEIRRPE